MTYRAAATPRRRSTRDFRKGCICINKEDHVREIKRFSLQRAWEEKAEQSIDRIAGIFGRRDRHSHITGVPDEIEHQKRIAEAFLRHYPANVRLGIRIMGKPEHKPRREHSFATRAG